MDVSSLLIKQIQEKMMAWYQSNARSLPWRGLHDPYLIWISEVMLQQTQVGTVIPYFKRWVDRFPDIESVASASIDEILKIWEGLGYYSRARNIKKTAEIVIQQFDRTFPSNPIDLRKLPGIGDYIAGAISSIGFGLSEPALDANGIRVISRLYDFHGLVDTTVNRRILKGYLRKLLPADFAGELNQAVMDLGSIVCFAALPNCAICPLQSECLAFSNATQNELPVKKARSKKPHFNVVAGIITKNGQVLIAKRLANGLLGGMWEFPGGKIEQGEDHQVALQRELEEELGISTAIKQAFGKYQHAYTHFSITVFPYFVEILNGIPSAKASERIEWVSLKGLDKHPMGKVDRSISIDLQKQRVLISLFLYNRSNG